MGKLTPDYWDGTVMYELFFSDSPDKTVKGPLVALSGALLGTNGKLMLAKWLSRVMIFSEIALGVSVLLPTRVLVPIAVLSWLGLLSIVPNTITLVAPLAAILSACWLFDRKLREDTIDGIDQQEPSAFSSTLPSRNS